MKPNYKKLYKKWHLQPETIQRIEPVNVNDDAGESSRNSSLDHSEQRKSHHLTLANENLRVIPQFYFQNGRPASTELKFLFISRINPFFNHTVRGMLMFDEKLKSITKELCQLPSFFSYALFRKIDTEGTGVMTRDAFINYWFAGNMMMMDAETKIYKILKQPDCEYLSQDDFKPILQRLLETHPALQLISASPIIQERYAETVLYRIFYYNNRSGNGRLTLRELKRGNLIDAMQHVDEEEDINKVLSYDGQALTSRIVARIFSQAPRKFTCEVQRRMNYEDFVYFFLSEGDKSSEPGIEYWFKCLDLDGNGKLTPDELRFFYEQQKARMVAGPMSFEDVLCQIIDMIAPERQDCITLRDLKQSKLSGNVFNLLFNLKRFYETGSMVEICRRFRNPELTEWDLFAEKELATIDNDDEVGSSSEDE